MGIFGKKPKPAKAKLEGDGEYSMNVVGESHYQDNLRRICEGTTDEEEGEDLEIEASLVSENDNPYDNQAVRVDIEGLPVGYLSRQDARRLRAHLDKTVPRGVRLEKLTCDALIVEGWDRGEEDRGYYGVKLDVPLDT